MDKDNLKLKIVLVFNFPMKIKSLEVSNICLEINRPGCLKVNIRKRNTKKEIRTTKNNNLKCIARQGIIKILHLCRLSMEINNNQRVSSSFLTFTNEIECKTQGLESGPEKNYFNQPAGHALLTRTDRQLTFLTGFSKKNCNTKNIPTYLTMIFFSLSDPSSSRLVCFVTFSWPLSQFSANS